MAIHPTAVIHSQATLGDDVEIGPFVVVGQRVTLGDGVRVDAHACVEGPTTIGAGTRLFPFCSVGSDPQDLKYDGEETSLEIGANNIIREGVTISRGTGAGGALTRIGDNNLFMANSHIAHDCHVGSNCIFANSAALAGHVVVGDGAVLGGMAGVHQNVRIGRLAMVGAGAMCAQDVPPFTIAQGDRARLFGLNIIGLRRAGFGHDDVQSLKQAYRTLFLAGTPLRMAITQVREDLGDVAEVAALLAFVEESQRGICRGARHEGRGAKG
jgi:UDP-N-acetylglucosamine acyltransferase